MARYIIKRKTFGVADAVQNTIGGAAETAGNIADTKIGGTVGGLLAGAKYGTALGGMLTGGATGGMLGTLAGPIGWLAAAGLGAAATRAAGKGLKSVGESIKTE